MAKKSTGSFVPFEEEKTQILSWLGQRLRFEKCSSCKQFEVYCHIKLYKLDLLFALDCSKSHIFFKKIPSRAKIFIFCLFKDEYGLKWFKRVDISSNLLLEFFFRKNQPEHTVLPESQTGRIIYRVVKLYRPVDLTK